MSANVVNSATHFSIAGARVFSITGGSNVFAGLGAGGANTEGVGNAFFGTFAGAQNTTGILNSIFGASAGTSNTTGGLNAFFGESAGGSNSTGFGNTFIGQAAGSQNTSGFNNTFNGVTSGRDTTTGDFNAFFGSGAGQNNSTGDRNTFIGRLSGGSISGSGNTALGDLAKIGSPILDNATAIGANSSVSQNDSLVLGSINGINGATADTRVGIGTTAPAERLHVVGNQLITGDLNVGGAITGTFNGTIATANNALNLGGIPAAQYAQVSALSNLNASNITSGTLNNARLGIVPAANGGTGIAAPGTTGNFLRSNGTSWTSAPLQPTDFPSGNGAYIQNTTVQQPSSAFNISGTGAATVFDAASHFSNAGSRILKATGGIVQNTFVGVSAGSSDPSGGSNTLVGFNAGRLTTSGFSNVIVGALAGNSNTTGSSNVLIGTSAGQSNTGGVGNTFVGHTGGLLNTIGGNNTFLGLGAGHDNTEGNNNVFIGYQAGYLNATGSRNTTLGQNAYVLVDGLTNATAIGSSAAVSQSNSLVLGSIAGVNSAPADTKVGIGTTAPTERLHVVGNQLITGNLNVSGTINGTFNGTIATADNALNLSGIAASQYVVTTDPRMTDARQPVSGNSSYVQNRTTVQTGTNFNISGVGNAGVLNAATQFNLNGSRILGVGTGTANTFGGINAGANASNLSDDNTFFGNSAGETMVTAGGNSFFGSEAGQNTTSGNNTFVGARSGKANTTGDSNSFFGLNAGTGNTTGDNNAFFGRNAGSANVTGSGNSFFGYQAGLSNTTSNNSFFGFQSGRLATGINNSFFGWSSGVATTTGTNNSFFGVQSGLSNTTGIDNSFFGRDAGRDNISGTGNAFFGRNSGLLTRGNNNTFIGLNAGNTNFAGTNNTALGANADVSSAALDFATAIGAGAVVHASNTVVLGRNSDAVYLPGSASVSNGLTVSSFLKLSGTGGGGVLPLCLLPILKTAESLVVSCASSIRYKDNVNSYTAGLSMINRLRPVSFNWKRNGMADIGFVAEEVASVEPLLTTTNENGEIESVKYDRISAVLVNAIKEQQSQIESQQKLIQDQQRQINELKRLVCLSNKDANVCKE